MIFESTRRKVTERCLECTQALTQCGGHSSSAIPCPTCSCGLITQLTSTRPVNHPTRVLKMCNVRTSEISQEPFSSCCSNCTIFSENWKKWDFLLFLCRSQTLRTIGAVPTLPLWTAHFFSSGEIWLLAPFSSKHTLHTGLTKSYTVPVLNSDTSGLLLFIFPLSPVS